MHQEDRMPFTPFPKKTDKPDESDEPMPKGKKKKSRKGKPWPMKGKK